VIELFMKYIILNPFIIIFLSLPVILLFLKIKYYKKVNVIILVLFQLLLGWGLIVAANFYYNSVLEKDLNYHFRSANNSNGIDSLKIAKTMELLTTDGARNVFSLVFGWLYSFLYSIPYIVFYFIYKKRVNLQSRGINHARS